MRNFLRLLKLQLLFAVIGVCGVTAFAQSPYQLKAKCPNTSLYAVVKIEGVGAVTVTPCVGQSTTFTGNVVIPAGLLTSLANGTAASPSLFFTNSTTTGVYRSAANVFGIATAGVENTLFSAAVNSQRSAGYTFQNVAADAQFALGFTPSTTVGTFTLGDCATTPTTCFKLTQSTDTISYGTGTATVSDQTALHDYQLQRTVTAGGTTGAQTISKPAGTLNVAAGQASIVLTNTLITTSTIPFVVLRTADTTCTFVKSAVPTANTLTITLNAACNAETSVGFIVYN